MELLRLIKKDEKGQKLYYVVDAEIDKTANEIKLLITKGIIGKKKSVTIPHLIRSSNIKLSNTKGINTIEKYAKEMGHKIYLKKMLEGYENDNNNEIIANENLNENSNNSKSINLDEDEEESKNPNIVNLNIDFLPKQKDNPIPLLKKNINNNKSNDNSYNNSIDPNFPNLTSYDLTQFNHEIKCISPDRMIYPINPVKHIFQEPMLAHKYEKRKRDITFPCIVQPKLDGVRCVVVDCELYSRYGNVFPTLEHIKEELKLNTEKLILDGELYTDDINFEQIVGLVKKGKKTPEEEKNSLKIYLNVFDYIEPGLTFEQRYSNLCFFFKKHNFQHLKLVKTEKCFSEKEIYAYLDKFIKEGYEGVIMRNIKGKYQPNTRSIHLQKLKKSRDEEFEIVGYSAPNTGTEYGCVIWMCKAKNGKTFSVKPLGNLDERRQQFINGKSYIGKKLTVKYQQLTNHGIPRFPIGLAIRDYEYLNKLILKYIIIYF